MGGKRELYYYCYCCSSHSITNLNIEDVIPSSSSSSTHPMMVLPITTPTLLSQVHIPTLTQSPRNSQTLYAPTTISTSVKSLLSFKDLMVDRKRIAIGQVLKEGECEEGCGWGGWECGELWVWRWECVSCGWRGWECGGSGWRGWECGGCGWRGWECEVGGECMRVKGIEFVMTD